MKHKTNNYARCKLTGSYVFFADEQAPNFTHPQYWAFWRVPAGELAELFAGQIVGANPADATGETRTQH